MVPLQTLEQVGEDLQVEVVEVGTETWQRLPEFPSILRQCSNIFELRVVLEFPEKTDQL